MKDFLGNELNIGDIIICNDKRYSNLIIAKIVKFTPKCLKALSPDLYQNDRTNISIYTSDQVIKITQHIEEINDYNVKGKIYLLNNKFEEINSGGVA